MLLGSQVVVPSGATTFFNRLPAKSRLLWIFFSAHVVLAGHQSPD